jgi:hypothetical protein
MRTRGLLLAGVFAVALLCAAPVGAFVPIELHTQVQYSADDLFGRTPLAFQYTTSRAVIDYAAVDMGTTLPWKLQVAYHDYKFGGSDDEAWTALGAYETRVNDVWGWGVQVPEQYWDPEDYDSIWYEGVTGYGYYNVTEQLRLGGFGHVNYAWTDVPGMSDELSYGFGAFGSYKLSLGDTAWVAPAFTFMHYSPGQEGWDDSNVFWLGSKLDVGIATGLGVEADLFYAADSTNDLIDDSFWKWDVGLRYAVSDKVELAGGVGTTESFENFDRTTIRLGARVEF